MESKKLIGDVDLNEGVVPITKAASSLAALIKRSHAHQQPIVVTQKGYPTGVILDVELFTALRDSAERNVSGIDTNNLVIPNTTAELADSSAEV